MSTNIPEEPEDVNAEDGVDTPAPQKPSKAAQAADFATTAKSKGIKGAAIQKGMEKATEHAPAAVQEKAVQAADVANKVATAQVVAVKTQAALAKAGAALINPITWIVIAALLLSFIITLTTISFTQVYGTNENAKGCMDPQGGKSSSSSVSVTNTGDWLGTATQVATWLMSTPFDRFGGKPLTFEQAAGIIGNWAHESGGMNPAATQSGFLPGTASNEQMLALGNQGGRAIGLAQWDSDRRTNLVKFAQKKGTSWNDITTQLEFFKHEVDTTANGSMLISKGFDNLDNDIDEMTKAFEAGFERAGKPIMGERIKYANQFADNYDGTYVPGGTGASCVIGGMNGAVNTSDSIQLAIQIAWPEREQSYVKPGQPHGKSAAKPEYIKVKEDAMSKFGADPMRDLYASCDRFVATIVKHTQDPEFPWGSTSEQFAYLKKSPKWEEYPTRSKQHAKPGDIWVTPRGASAGHIVMYIGNHEGRDTIAHASYLNRTGALDYASYINDSLRDPQGRTYSGFRFVG
jgi:hypothetical protein